MVDVLAPRRARAGSDDAAHLDGDAPASALAGTVAEHLLLLVAPSTGRFRPDGVRSRDVVDPGTVLGHVTGGGGRADAVLAPTRAEVADLLVRPGQLVYRGQGLAWLRRPDGVQGAA